MTGYCFGCAGGSSWFSMKVPTPPGQPPPTDPCCPRHASSQSEAAQQTPPANQSRLRAGGGTAGAPRSAARHMCSCAGLCGAGESSDSSDTGAAAGAGLEAA